MVAHDSQPDDRELFKEIALGDEVAFGILFHRYGPQLHAFINGIVHQTALADELVQEVFLKIWLKRETLPDIENPKSWIYRIASNLSLTQYRRQRLEESILHTLGRNPTPKNPGPDDALDLKELNDLIHAAARKLPTQRRRIFELSRKGGKTRREIAEELGISEFTVRNQLSIALTAIQEHIRKTTGIYLPLIFLASRTPGLANYFFG